MLCVLPSMHHIVCLPLFLASVAQDTRGTAPPAARALSRELCEEPRLAGTSGGARGADFVAHVLGQAGFTVERDERDVLLSFPRHIEIVGRRAEGILFSHDERFDPRADPPGDVPKYNAWAGSGSVDARVVDVGHGLRADYEELAVEGVVVQGCIALARYGGAYRGVKVRLAEEFGCVGCLLFSDPDEDGAGRGTVWPDGPWKPGWEAQRGSVSPLDHSPGDPSTPGWPSPRPGEKSRRLTGEELERGLPGIPCLPIGADDALLLLEAGAEARVSLALDQPRELYRIVNVIGRIPRPSAPMVIAGNHRDTWVRGAHDAGSGTVALLRAAQILGARVRDGWTPPAEIIVAFWDAEEHGLIGSTEWGEANAEELRRRAVAYVNADSAVSGLSFRVSGTPGLEDVVRRALEKVAAPVEDVHEADHKKETLWTRWSEGGTRRVELDLPGSGSDYAVFLHHLGIPVLDIGFGGNPGGQYHTSFDDFELMDRFLDPTWQGHETAGQTIAELLTVLAERGFLAFDPARAARTLADVARSIDEENDSGWLPEEERQRLAAAFSRLAETIESTNARLSISFYQALEDEHGLDGRRWYKNRLWAPGLETGYAAESFPGLRAAAREGNAALERELSDLIGAIRRLEAVWRVSGTEHRGGSG